MKHRVQVKANYIIKSYLSQKTRWIKDIMNFLTKKAVLILRRGNWLTENGNDWRGINMYKYIINYDGGWLKI